ncbi:DUF3556 domain-containing protein [Nocardia vaccinii]|uniref:DUF3556 domain-containing protein n=1 Tax=Nocardia vaccinii TaxID=1822 RepID=UPI000833F144|nr:DUF3556 domain-containing protein [Nocardia vaccinii]
MGFKEADFPPVDLETFLDEPLMERMKALALHWVEYGFGTPKMIHTIYMVKVMLLYVVGGIALVTWTSRVGPFWAVAHWWNQPVIYQKLILWTVLLEAIGIAGSWGPIAGKFKPMIGGILFYARPGTIRLRPWKRVPFTDGDRRTAVDALLYLAFLVSLVVPIVLPGTLSASLTAALPDNTSGLVSPALLIAPIVLYVLCGLRDKTIFLAARGEQYLPALVFFAVLPFTDMIIAAKLLIVVVWVGAGVSKFGRHFTNVVSAMVSNNPFVVFPGVKRLYYRDFPRDIRPSGLASLTAHAGGSLVEIAVPLVLLFSADRWVTLAAVALMVVFHLTIISMFALAVPQEWNVIFGYLTVFLFLGFPAGNGYAVWNMSSPLLLAGIIVALVFFPILGNLRPDLVSFLPSMRQYAGNWASALWAFAPGAEAKLNTLPHRPTENQIDQLHAMGYPPAVAEITMQQTIAWRSMHSQGRGLFSLLLKNIPDIDRWTIREAEFGCNSVIGFNFGDGHLHSLDLINAVQARVGFDPGEWIVVWVESQPIHRDTQEYMVVDAALGVLERGTWRVRDAVEAMPWLPDGPIPHQVTWRREDAFRALFDKPEPEPEPEMAS